MANDTIFSVDVRDLPGLPRMILRARGDVEACADYLQTYQDLPWREVLASGALIALVKPAHDNVVKAVDSQLRRGLGKPGAYLAEDLVSAIQYYSDTDTKAAARNDSLRPGAEHPENLTRRYDPLDPPVPLFTDVVRPNNLLTPPPDHSGDFAKNPIDLSRDAVSLTRAGRDVVWQLTEIGTRLGWCDRPIDIFAEIVQPVVGNWPAMLQLADVFTNIGRACAGVNQNFAENQINIRAVWQGRASDAFQEHLRLFGLTHVGTQEWLNQIADCYRRIGVTVNELVGKLADVLVRIVDMAVAALIAAQAAEATAPTIVGPAVFGSAALYEFYQFWQALQTGLELGEATDLLVKGYLQELAHLARLDSRTGLPAAPPPIDLPDPPR
ncbi:hypothetical protein GCM10009682_53230 [Luedemannella flava]|uniref:Uncharacterized protein n=1 Tax=Luedemannella flava TaxID=349316 RepID=A0ABN2MHJ2_9ACTN